MIREYKITLCPQNSGAVKAELAYHLYGALMQQVDAAFADLLHDTQSLTPVAQYVDVRQDGSILWHISVFGRDAIDAFSFLGEQKYFQVQEGVFKAETCAVRELHSVQELWQEANDMPDFYACRLFFDNPTSFKTDGHYALYPTIPLLVQSMSNRMQELLPEVLLSDADALRMLQEGLRITDYRLNSAYYSLKGSSIPGFTGMLRIQARLSAPIMELWKMLLTFSTYSGIGIKTALGMGGVQTAPAIKKQFNS